MDKGYPQVIESGPAAFTAVGALSERVGAMSLFRVPIEISYTDAGGPGVNVWAVRTTGPGDALNQDQLEDAVAGIHAFYQFLRDNGTAPSNLWASGTTFALGTIVERDTDEEWDAPWTDIVCSTGTGDLPPHLAVCVSWRTSVRARRGMGRTFLGPLNSGALETNGSLAPGVLTMVNSAASTLISASIAGSGWAIGVYGQESKIPGATPEDRRNAPHVHRDITNHQVRDQFAVLRSRRDNK